MPAGNILTVMSTMNARRLVLRDDLAELRRLAEWIGSWAHDVTPGMLFAIQLCVEEAVANVIMYGNTKDEPLEIAVELERTDDGTLVARVEDTGRQFDPTRVPPPTLATSLADAKVGNLGIHLMRSFASGMHYQRRDDRNRLTLRFIENRRQGVTT